MAFKLVAAAVLAFVVCSVSAQISLSLPGTEALQVKFAAKPEDEPVPSAPVEQPKADEEPKPIRRRRDTNDESPIPESQPEALKPIYQADEVGEEKTPVRRRRDTTDSQDEPKTDPDLVKEPVPSAPVA